MQNKTTCKKVKTDFCKRCRTEYIINTISQNYHKTQQCKPRNEKGQLKETFNKSFTKKWGRLTSSTTKMKIKSSHLIKTSLHEGILVLEITDITQEDVMRLLHTKLNDLKL